jgi:hypothetical protein
MPVQWGQSKRMNRSIKAVLIEPMSMASPQKGQDVTCSSRSLLYQSVNPGKDRTHSKYGRDGRGLSGYAFADDKARIMVFKPAD